MKREGIAGGQESGSNLGIGCGAHDVGVDLGEGMYNAVGDDGGGRLGSEDGGPRKKPLATRLRASFSER